MKTARLAGIGIGCILYLFFCTRPLAACSCRGNSSPCGNFETASAVFIGEVVSIDENKAEPKRFGESGFPRSAWRAHFRVESEFKGLSKKQQSVTVETGSGMGDCGYHSTTGFNRHR